jgi:hypothetical protein
MKYTNEVYPKLKEYINAHGGFNSDELKQEAVYNDYIAFMDLLKGLDGKKIEMSFTSQSDWFHATGKKVGKIKIVNDEVRFYEGRKTARFYYLDGGIYEGFYATLVPLEIEVIK